MKDNGTRNVTSVKLHSSVHWPTTSDLDFIDVGEIDGSTQEQLLTIWKLDNREFIIAEEDEDDYDQVKITFASGADATYGFAYVLSGQMPDDMIRNWEEIAIDDQSTHDIKDFVLETDALIISAHLWSAAAARDATVSDHENWNQNNSTTGLAIQHDLPNAADEKELTVTFESGGQPANADSLAAAVVIRSDDEIVHTPSHTPGTLGGTGDGEYWLEGVIAQKGAAASVGDRSDISDWGSITTGKATWIPGHMADGKSSSSDYRRITHEEPPQGNNTINIMAFSPLNADREEVFDLYLAGVISELEDSIGSDGTHRHIGTLFLNDWADYDGVVLWDLERFCLHYDRARGHQDSTNWGPPNKTYDVSIRDDPDLVPEWEYNAATRYYWERVHQWFVEIYAPNVKALVFYQHPQGPDASEGLSGAWWGTGQAQPYDHAGEEWQKEIEWVYKMQGAFDGRCSPPSALDDSEIDDGVLNVLENFRIISEHLNLFVYVHHWPSRPGIEAYEDAFTVEEILAANEDIRGRTNDPWSDFDAYYAGTIGMGDNWGETFAIDSVTTGLNSTVTIAEQEVANQFDPLDLLEISGSLNNDEDEYRFESAVHQDGDTIVSFDDPPEISTSNAPLGDLITPDKTPTDFDDWWAMFLTKWDLQFP